MDIIRITKEFHFEMAHALHAYDGACRNIHGHSYRLQVTLKGKPNTDKGDPKYGMVLDFQDLKKLVKGPIVDVLDHSLVLSDATDKSILEQFRSLYEKVYVFDFQPTCENLAAYMAERIKENLPSAIQLHSLRLYETANSYAEWYAEDNS